MHPKGHRLYRVVEDDAVPLPRHAAATLTLLDAPLLTL